MQNNLAYTFLIGGLVLVLFGIGELLHHYTGVKPEYTRKLIHAGTGFVTLLCPLLIDNQWYIFGLCLSFAMLLILSLRLGFLKSINNIGRESYGSVSYAIAVYFCFLVFTWQNDNLFFFLPILILALADPLAALKGKRWDYGKFTIYKETKTITGGITFFIVAFIISATCIYIHTGYELNSIIWVPLVISIVSALTEAFTENGLDNITIPLVVIILMLTGKHFEIGL
jgi:phytol kinase